MGVLKDLVARLLQKYAGQYLDVPSDFDLSLFKGKAELVNVNLKPDALDALGLPLIVKSGLVGRLTLHLPITNLKTQPSIISVENVVLIAKFKHWTKEEYDRMNAAKKKRQLELDELNSNTETEGEDEGSTLKKLLAQVLNNLQITVKNVTVRLEDEMGRIHSTLGLNVESISVSSTDSNFGQSPVFFKLVNIQGLSIFCTPNSTTLSTDIGQLFQQVFMTPIPAPNYLLRPVNVLARLIVQKSFFPKDGAPIFDAEILFDNAELSIFEQQFKAILQAIDSMHYRQLYPFSSLRPNSPPKSSPQDWWKYAFEAVSQRLRQQQRFLVYTTEYVKYCRMKALAIEEKSIHKSTRKIAETQLAKLEVLLPYEEIAAARSLAARQQSIDRKTLNGVLFQGKKGGFRTLGQKIKNTFNEIRLADQDFQVSEAELTAFLAEFSLSPEERKSEGQPQLRLRLQLATLLVELRETVELNSAVVKTQASGFSLDTTLFTNRASLRASLASINVIDQNPASTHLPTVLESEAFQTEDFISLFYEGNPTSLKVDHRLEIRTQPLVGVLNRKLIEKILAIFQEDLESDTAYHIQQSAEQQVDDTTARLRNTARRSLISLSINVGPVRLLIPNAVDGSVSSLLSIEVGSLFFGKNATEILPDLYPGYTNFDLSVAALQVGFAEATLLPDLTAALAGYKGMLQPLDASLRILFAKHAGAANEPDVRVEGSIPEATATLTPYFFARLRKIAVSMEGIEEVWLRWEERREGTELAKKKNALDDPENLQTEVLLSIGNALFSMKSDAGTPILQLGTANLPLQLFFRPFDWALQIQIPEVQGEDCQGGEYHLLRTIGEAKINVFMVTPHSPQFESTHKSIEENIKVLLPRALLVLSQGTTSRLLQFFSACLEEEKQLSDFARKSARFRRQFLPTQQVIVAWDSIDVELRDQVSFVSVGLQSASIIVDLSKQTESIRLALASIRLTHLLTETVVLRPHTNAVGGEFLSVNFFAQRQADGTFQENLGVNVSGVEVYLADDAIRHLSTFLSELDFTGDVIDHSRQLYTIRKAQKIEPKSSLLFRVCMEPSLFIIPEINGSPNFLTIRLGKIDIENRFRINRFDLVTNDISINSGINFIFNSKNV